MKVKVVARFRDKKTDALHLPGTVFEIDEKRFKEIDKVLPGALEEYKENTPKKEKEAAPKDDTKSKKEKADASKNAINKELDDEALTASENNQEDVAAEK